MAESIQIQWEREMGHSGAAFLTAYPYRFWDDESRVWMQKSLPNGSLFLVDSVKMLVMLRLVSQRPSQIQMFSRM